MLFRSDKGGQIRVIKALLSTHCFADKHVVNQTYQQQTMKTLSHVYALNQSMLHTLLSYISKVAGHDEQCNNFSYISCRLSKGESDR